MNGLLIGYLRLRAFLTTLVTLIIVRAVVDMMVLALAVPIAAGFVDSHVWTNIGEERSSGYRSSFVVFLVIAVLAPTSCSVGRVPGGT